MIAFDNFEKCVNDPNMINPKLALINQNSPYMNNDRQLEAIKEEFIESEPETPVEFPDVN